MAANGQLRKDRSEGTNMAVTKPAGGWTYDDLFNLPDDGKHYEIIDGELYELPRRESDHGRVVMNLIGLLLPIADQLGGQLFTGPLGLFLARRRPGPARPPLAHRRPAPPDQQEI